MANLDEATIIAVYDATVTHCMTTGYFSKVNTHEPKNAPADNPIAAVWQDWLGPYPGGSGLANTTAIMRLSIRVYQNFRSDPIDMIDPNVVVAVNSLMAAFSGDFDFGVAKVRCVDLLGMSGIALQAQAGYVEIDHKLYRIMTITLPIIIDDAWVQAQ